MKVRVDLVGGLLMVGRTGNHAAAFDAPQEQGREWYERVLIPKLSPTACWPFSSP